MRNIFLSILSLYLIACGNSIDNDINYINFEKYLFRDDSLFCSAIKIIPGKGSYNWIANNHIYEVKGIYYLNLSNYADTTNWNLLESWAFQREYLTIYLDPYKYGTIDIVNRQAFDLDHSLFKALYTKWEDGGD